jgi:GT2 family glycosyltransferase
MPEAALSVIVPLGPGDRVDRVLRARLDDRPDDCELILSAASTPGHEMPRGSKVILGPAGRARQLNRGAEASGARWLWFLHADSRIEPDAIERALAFARGHPGVIGYGWLRFLTDGPALTRLNALAANLRSRLFRLPYGDQGLCIEADTLKALGGFREELERGEDLDLVVRARETGVPIRPMGLTVATSARRYDESGWLRTSWRHQLAARRLILNARNRARTESS